MPEGSRARYNLVDMLGKLRANVLRAVIVVGIAALVSAGAAPSARIDAATPQAAPAQASGDWGI